MIMMVNVLMVIVVVMNNFFYRVLGLFFVLR